YSFNKKFLHPWAPVLIRNIDPATIIGKFQAIYIPFSSQIQNSIFSQQACVLIKIEYFHPVFTIFIDGDRKPGSVGTELHASNTGTKIMVSSYGTKHRLAYPLIADGIKAKGIVSQFMKGHPSGIPGSQSSRMLGAGTK